ncbi:MAG: hypothetical protein ACRD3T_13455 [Terriglobia bacterium]
MKGFIHIIKFTSGQADYGLSFAPIGPSGTGGSVPLRKVEGRRQLRALLEQLRIRRESIKSALEEAERAGSASIAIVDLDEDDLRNLHLTQVAPSVQR